MGERRHEIFKILDQLSYFLATKLSLFWPDFETLELKTDVAPQPSLASGLIFITIFFILADFVNKCHVIFLDSQINDEIRL